MTDKKLTKVANKLYEKMNKYLGDNFEILERNEDGKPTKYGGFRDTDVYIAAKTDYTLQWINDVHNNILIDRFKFLRDWMCDEMCDYGQDFDLSWQFGFYKSKFTYTHEDIKKSDEDIRVVYILKYLYEYFADVVETLEFRISHGV